MRVLVVGATGGTGREVVRLGTGAGHDMVAMVRHPGAGAEFERTVVADVLDPAQVAAALSNVDAVICCLGVRMGEIPGVVRSAGTANLVGAMESGGPDRLVAVSTVGVGSSVQFQNWFARRLWPRLVGRERLEEARRAEDAVMASALDWTVVRPPRLTDKDASGSPDVGEDLRTGMQSTLSRTELAGVLLQAVIQEAWHRESVTAVSR